MSDPHEKVISAFIRAARDYDVKDTFRPPREVELATALLFVWVVVLIFAATALVVFLAWKAWS